MILDTVVNHGKSANNSSGTQNPSRDEYIHVAVGRAGCSLYLSHQDQEKTYGTNTASACHTPAAPADCNPLSMNTEFRCQLGNSQNDLQNPVNTASFAKSFDMAPNSQYTNVCHMASRRPQKMYSQARAGYAESLKSIFAGKVVRV